jgi:hypothetical protein
MSPLSTTIYEKVEIFLHSKKGIAALIIVSLITLISQSYFLIALCEKKKAFFILCGIMAIIASTSGLNVAFQRAKNLKSNV